MGKTKRIYLDYNATTPLHPEVLEAMLPFLKEVHGNPSSIHGFGQEARKGLDEAREKVAKLIGVSPGEIVFTSGGTEADNLAIQGVAFSLRHKGRHIITSSVEHHAVLRTCRYLEHEGFRVTYLPVDGLGQIDPDDVKHALTPETILITLMHSNNEVGTIEPIEEVGKIAASHGILFHTDAVQSIGKVAVDARAISVDLLSMSGHKLYGPKGVGALYVRDGVKLSPLLYGGHHEGNRRAGTENLPGIVAFGKAAELALSSLGLRHEAMRTLRDYFWDRIREEIPRVHLHGHPDRRLPNTLHVSFESVSAESLLIQLDLSGIAASAGSACTSGAMEVSHVLTAMGVPRSIAQGGVRFSLGPETTREEIDHTVSVLKAIVNRLRFVSGPSEEAVEVHRS